jgi:DNA gyrase subunit B
LTAYNSKSIKVLEGLEPVRQRPGMYIGNTGVRGLHHLVYELIDNSIDEYLAGYCDRIVVSMNKDGSITVEDNGRGIPVDLHENTRDYPAEKYPRGITTERILLTVLHSGGKFDSSTYKVSGGLHGVGISVVNALSSYMKVEIFRDGNHYIDEYENGGKPIAKLNDGELVSVGKTDKRGTCITFFPDSNIFETVEFKADIIKKRLKELSYLNKGLTIEFYDYTGDEIQHEVFHQEDGIIGFIREINHNKETTHDNVIYIDGSKDDVIVELAFQMTTDFNENIFSFCNNINTIEGGTHLTGFKSAITKVVNKYVKEMGLLKGKDAVLDGRDIRSGLTAILSVKLKNPQFDGQTKTKLGNSDVRFIVEDIVSEQLEFYFDRNKDDLVKVAEQAIKAYNMRKTVSKARENFLSKSNTLSVNSKLAACQEKYDPEKGVLTELFIVEGDSAGGSAKQGRNRKFQAILPLWGKMLNVEKVKKVDEVYENEKLAPVILAIGTGAGEDFDITKLKYDKIIIMADADVDGSHIRTLLLTFFFRYMRPLIEQGHVYIAQPPLFKIMKGKKHIYAYSDTELDKVIKSYGWKKEECTIQRYKGLGEMNPEQLWETTMNPATRILKRIEFEDIIEAEAVTSALMSEKVPPRKEFIEKEAKKANIDV